MSLWESKQSESSQADKKALAIAQKREEELDRLIRGIFEGKVAGTISERQAQRLIGQYDEEQIQLEEQIISLKDKIANAESGKPDVERFMKIIRKYQDYSELTDTMLYEFIDRVEVHAATGGRTVYRQQKIDIYFNFIGNYIPPNAVITEEERIAKIEEKLEQKKAAKRERANQRARERLQELKDAAKTDPEAEQKYEKLLEQGRESNRRVYEKKKIEDPEYHRNRSRREYEKKSIYRAELIKNAPTDPEAAEKLEEIRAMEREKSHIVKARREERAAHDPEYAEKIKQKKAECVRRRTAQRKEARAELIERAKTDPQAAQELAELRAYGREAAYRSLEKKKARAAIEPEYAAMLKERQQERYQRQKAKKQEQQALAVSV
jgi:hypothetical protein